jgi:hypothetical protein
MKVLIIICFAMLSLGAASITFAADASKKKAVQRTKLQSLSLPAEKPSRARVQEVIRSDPPAKFCTVDATYYCDLKGQRYVNDLCLCKGVNGATLRGTATED